MSHQFTFSHPASKLLSVPFSTRPVAQGVHRFRAPVPVRRPVLCAPAVPTAPARPWSACGAAARSAASTPLRTSSPSPTDSVWSGRPRTVLVRWGGWVSLEVKGGDQIYARLGSGVRFRSVFVTMLSLSTKKKLYSMSTCDIFNPISPHFAHSKRCG